MIRGSSFVQSLVEAGCAPPTHPHAQNRIARRDGRVARAAIEEELPPDGIHRPPPRRRKGEDGR